MTPREKVLNDKLQKRLRKSTGWEELRSKLKKKRAKIILRRSIKRNG